MTRINLAEVLRLHGMWLQGEYGGVMANLTKANLTKANLREANLTKAVLKGAVLKGANFSRADLSRADLSEANLSRANLSWANLSNADLTKANLSGADISNADLKEANLSNADLKEANLSWANLTKADLSGADLSNADLTGANITNAILPPLPVTLPEGDFIGWKKVRGNVILELKILKDSKRTGSLVGPKCRTDQVLVLSAQRPDGSPIEDQKTFESMWKPSFTYTVDESVGEPSFSDDIRVECASGIHFFLSREEAVKFTL